MPGSGNTTAPSLTEDPVPRAPGTRRVAALLGVFNADDPDHVGAVALLDDASHSVWMVGRDGPTPDDPAARAAWVYQGPGVNLDASPLTGIKISRDQLRVARVPGGLEIENNATPVVLIDGVALAKGKKRRIEPGAIIQVRGHSMFLFVMRPLLLPPRVHGTGPLHVFGGPDADGIVGESPVAWALREAIAAAVVAAGHVFINGPTGTGKELVAGAIHRQSGRRGPMVPCNAATLTLSLLESLLYGNRANYPNAPAPERKGLVFEAMYGTLFLDEIGELSAEAQTRFLRALEGQAMRLGDSVAQRIDVRFVGATNRDLAAVMRLDFFNRFIYVLDTPSIAQRIEDIPLLARHLVLKLAREKPKLAGRFVTTDAAGRQQVLFTPALVRALLGASFEGNMRDLEKLLVRAMLDNPAAPLLPPNDMTPWRARPQSPPAPEAPPSADSLLDGFLSKGALVHTLEAHGWNVTETAKALGKSRDRVKRLMERYGIKRPGRE